MAERRMFAKTIIDSDAFLDMPLSTQALYFHLSMRADDDGFVNNPKKIQRMIGASDDDFKILIGKSFLIPFDSGIVVIKHWKIHNYIQSDRYKGTVYTEEKACLEIKKNKAYTLNVPEVDTECIQDVSKLETQVRLGKDRLGEVRKEEEADASPSPKDPKKIYGEYKHVRLKEEEYNKLVNELGEKTTQDCIRTLDEYIEMKGTKYKSHYLAIKKWVVDAVKKKPQQQSSNKFKNFQERDYDMDDLESKLLGRR